MIKKYNRIFVNLSAVAGDVFAISILPLPCERGPICLLYSLLSSERFGVSALLTIFYFFPALRAGALWCPRQNQSRKLPSQRLALWWGSGHLRRRSKETPAQDWLLEAVMFPLYFQLTLPLWLFFPGLWVRNCPGKWNQDLTLGLHSVLWFLSFIRSLLASNWSGLEASN